MSFFESKDFLPVTRIWAFGEYDDSLPCAEECAAAANGKRDAEIERLQCERDKYREHFFKAAADWDHLVAGYRVLHDALKRIASIKLGGPAKEVARAALKKVEQ